MVIPFSSSEKVKFNKIKQILQFNRMQIQLNAVFLVK